jgi:N-acetylglutamate synthase-like GNAT family acetyltransferase
MLENIDFKELSIDDINNDLLDNFNRYQEVKKCYVKDNGNWVIRNNEFIENWDKNKKINVINNFSKIIDEGGYIFGAYYDKKLIGFSALLNNKFGSNEHYIELKYIHVSLEYRHKGIGKKLFNLCIEKAKNNGIEKIYISANSSEETQNFYLGIGCKDAMEINKKAAEDEPYDRQMEYKI